MALSLGTGSGTRRWPCRAARRGQGGLGCRHFHVHYHFPRQVRAFSPLRLPPPLFSLLALPVLLFAVLAFLVCFGWFTFLYFVSSLLLRKCNGPGFSENGRDASGHCSNEEQARNEEERVGDSAAEGTGTAPCCTCTTNLVRVQIGRELVANGKEDPAYVTSGVLELIDEHETTRTVVAICSDESAEDKAKSGAGSPDDDDFAEKVPEGFFDEQQDARTVVTDHLVEETEKENHVLGTSDETYDLNNESETPAGSLIDSVSETQCATVATPDAPFDHARCDEEDGPGHARELTGDHMAGASGTASVACDFSAGNNQAVGEEIAAPSSGDIISVTGRTWTGDEDGKSRTSEISKAGQGTEEVNSNSGSSKLLLFYIVALEGSGI